MKSKKGAEKMLSVYWFLILVIVAFGIWAMAYSFYSHPFDIREVENRVLSNKVADCVSQKGVLVDSLFNEEGEFIGFTESNIESNCHFNFDVEDEFGWRGDEQYYIKVSFFTVNENPKFTNITYGDPEIETLCREAVESGQEFERLPKCVTRRFYTLDNKNEQTLVEIVTGVRKVEKNVKI